MATAVVGNHPESSVDRYPSTTANRIRTPRANPFEGSTRRRISRSNRLSAGARALLLSGAFGGLLGALKKDEFLPAANDYLLRQEWEEGFATAAHVVLDLETGEFEVFNAGHPPGAQFVAGSGRWEVITAEGPLLGVLTDAEYRSSPGRLGSGDALLLYTDGLIEEPGRDILEGLDRLLGEAERLVTKGFRHGARKLIDAVAKDVGDDRALVVIWRT